MLSRQGQRLYPYRSPRRRFASGQMKPGQGENANFILKHQI